MMIYCVKFIDRVTDKVMYKIGHTKYGPKNFHKRFDYPEYDCFDIELLDHVILSHGDWKVAKAAIISIENMIRVVIPAKSPSFMIEEYFDREPNTMKLSGVTELIFLKENQTETMLLSTFGKFKKAIIKTSKELNEKIGNNYGTYSDT